MCHQSVCLYNLFLLFTSLCALYTLVFLSWARRRKGKGEKKECDGQVNILPSLYWDPLHFSDGLHHPHSTSFIIFPSCTSQHPSSLIQAVFCRRNNSQQPFNHHTPHKKKHYYRWANKLFSDGLVQEKGGLPSEDYHYRANVLFFKSSFNFATIIQENMSLSQIYFKHFTQLKWSVPRARLIKLKSQSELFLRVNLRRWTTWKVKVVDASTSP